MNSELINKAIKEFIETELSHEDFGYLVIPDDERLNSEAAYVIKNKFWQFMNDKSDTTQR